MVMFWVAILAVSILLYVLLDGFDLGVGMLFGLTHDETRRRAMLSAIAPMWDGNETWLVVAGVVLWGAFPVVYATLLSAFYLPVVLALAGLILRGVAFEYRNKTERLRWIWDAGFAGGSLVAAFIQGMIVGALVEQLPIANGQYTGGDFGWFSPFAMLCGVGLCLGYALLGACWLVRKCEGDVREAAYRLIPYLAVSVLVFLVVVFAYALAENLRVVHRWLERPYLFVFPAIGAIAALVAAASVRRRRDEVPFHMVALIFAAAFGTLAISFWPYMIPFSITIEDAAAPHSSLAFMFWGEGLFVFPLMLLYTVISYTVFRGKVRPTAEPLLKQARNHDHRPWKETVMEGSKQQEFDKTRQSSPGGLIIRQKQPINLEMPFEQLDFIPHPDGPVLHTQPFSNAKNRHRRLSAQDRWRGEQPAGAELPGIAGDAVRDADCHFRVRG